VLRGDAVTTIWTRVNTIILLLALFTLLAVLAMLATGARGGPLDPPAPPAATDSVRLPGTPITGPTTINQPGHYYLTRNISITGAQTAIAISASGVTLDLGGFTIDGDDNAGSLGISISEGGFGNITIDNGVVSDFLIGLNVDAGVAVMVDHVTVSSNVVGMEVGLRSQVSGCSAHNNTTGISMLGVGAGSVIRDCLVTDSNIGIFSEQRGVIRGSDVLHNSTDLQAVALPNFGLLVVIDTTYCSTSGNFSFVGGFNFC
jgi:hypothetical protein